MDSFLFVTLLLILVVASHVINRFFPAVSVPLIQVLLGILTVFLPWHVERLIDPNLIFVLFIAPLIFNDGKQMNKAILWTHKKPIMFMAIILVFITVFVAGASIHVLLPSISFAAACALAAALAPTDAVAVCSLSERVSIPGDLMGILEEESIINDASGIVSFQFALAAVLTGSFSIVSAGVSFIFVALGGIIVGLVLTTCKYFFVRWIRRLGMEDAVLHVLLEVLTPFIVYLVAQELGVSGILAAVTSGLAHSFGARGLNPGGAKLHSLSNNIWSVLSFTLNGLVFLLLGTQLPGIISAIAGDSEHNILYILPIIVVITVLLAALRFICSLISIKPNEIYSEDERLSSGKTALIVALAGAKGVVTLASAMSIPLLLSDGAAFPERNLILFLASGVIVLSLLIANFALPPLVKKVEGAVSEDDVIYLEILNSVVQELKNQSTDEDKPVFDRVINAYLERIEYHRRKINKIDEKYSESEIILMILEWEKEIWLKLADEGKVDRRSALRAVKNSCKRLARGIYDDNERRIVKKEQARLSREERSCSIKPGRLINKEHRILIQSMWAEVIPPVVERLTELQKENEEESVRLHQYILRYEQLLNVLAIDKHEHFSRLGTRDSNAVERIAALGFTIEKECIQNAFERDRISKEKAKEFKANVSAMEYAVTE